MIVTLDEHQGDRELQHIDLSTFRSTLYLCFQTFRIQTIFHRRGVCIKHIFNLKYLLYASAGRRRSGPGERDEDRQSQFGRRCDMCGELSFLLSSICLSFSHLYIS